MVGLSEGQDLFGGSCRRHCHDVQMRQGRDQESMTESMGEDGGVQDIGGQEERAKKISSAQFPCRPLPWRRRKLVDEVLLSGGGDEFQGSFAQKVPLHY
eukprot:749566-Hanusia_phi.AAC.3